MLLTQGHFRPAAALAAAHLTGSPPPASPAALFALFHARLASLLLIGQPALAATEALAFGDPTASRYRHPATGMSLLPWGLRVLLARLAAAVEALYALAAEARREGGRAARGSVQRRLWAARLRGVGVEIAGVLVEMGELRAAVRFAEALVGRGGRGGGAVLAEDEKERGRGDGEEEEKEKEEEEDEEQEGERWRARIVLLYLRIGNVRAAKRVLRDLSERQPGGSITGVLEPLVSMAEGRYTDAIDRLSAAPAAALPFTSSTITSAKEDTTTTTTSTTKDTKDIASSILATHNRAVALVYANRLDEARTALQGLVATGHAFPTLLANLATVFELWGEGARAAKLALAETVAGRAPDGTVWERGAAEFRL